MRIFFLSSFFFFFSFPGSTRTARKEEGANHHPPFSLSSRVGEVEAWHRPRPEDYPLFPALLLSLFLHVQELNATVLH